MGCKTCGARVEVMQRVSPRSGTSKPAKAKFPATKPTIVRSLIKNQPSLKAAHKLSNMICPLCGFKLRSEMKSQNKQMVTTLKCSNNTCNFQRKS